MNLPSERLVIVGVAIDEIIEDFVGCPLVKALVDENPNNGVGQLFYPVRPPLFKIAADCPEQHGPRDVVAIRAPLGPMPVPQSLLPFPLLGVPLLLGLSCHVFLLVFVDGTMMVRGPAARRKPFVTETQSLCFESEFRSFESVERNLFRVAGTLNTVVGNRSITAADMQAVTPRGRSIDRLDA
ncbi:hypothetical protein FOB41_23990 [Agrobacterium pusense]|uniref:Uncharacterized protein n=1 Tax=Agrobacterium pusense TaxID=648995 RepID=A0A6H0ZTN9_9HYPH|nr:hypothetical protein [Agrobacterium pusense]QIX24166.1 hypothetical protein FOB41_23990 [Agrobacterium pusense]